MKGARRIHEPGPHDDQKGAASSHQDTRAAPDPRVTRSRQRALAAALDLVAEQGVAGATIEAISARSGVAKTTIYRQWPHQGPLVLDAFRSVAADPPDPDTGTLRGDLLVLLGGLADALSSGPAGELIPALLDASRRDPDFARLHSQEAARRHQHVLTVLRRGLERGELPAGVDLDELVDRLAGPVFHRRFISGLPFEPGFTERVVDGVLRAPTGESADLRHDG